MFTRKRRRFICAEEEEEDKLIRKIFKVTLEKDSVLEKDVDKGKLVNLLCKDIMEGVLKDCLSEKSDGNSETFRYLIKCYHRANREEEKNQIRLAMAEIDYNQCCAMNSISRQAKELVVSHCLVKLVASVRLTSRDKDYDMTGCVKKKREANFRESYLLPLLYSKVSGFRSGNGLKCPYGFFEQLIEASDFDSLGIVLTPLYEDLRSRVIKENLFGNFEKPLRGLIYLVKNPIGAKILVNHPLWIPKFTVTNGIELERLSILGAFFNVSLIPDDRFIEKRQRRQSMEISYGLLIFRTNAESCFAKEVRTLTKKLHDGLEEVLLCLLNNSDTQENVFKYLSEIIRQNSSLTSIQVDPNCGSLGMFVNLSAVMLRLCKNFLDEDLTKKSEIDGTYVFCNSHLDMSGLTTLHASSKEVAGWIDKLQHIGGLNLMSNSPEEATSSGNNMGLVSILSKINPTALPCGKTRYTFGCDFFFMTARVLHLGLIKSLSELQRLHQKLGLNKTALSIINVLVGQAPFPQPEKDMELLHKELEVLFEGKRKLKLDWRNFCCYLSQILQDKALLQEALSFYRLMVVWLVDLVGGFKMPLPLSCPIEFACVPEHLVEDAIEMLIVVFTYSELLNDIIPEMDEFMKFIIMFMASSNYIRNSYIRQRMVELLGLCISNRRCSSSVITVFEGNQLCLEFLVRNLLVLYVSKEFASPNQVQFRRTIMQILGYLWEIPSHRNAWRQIAEEDTGFYVVFLNSVINDNIQLLDNNINRILQATDEEVSSTEGREHMSFLREQERALYIQLEKDMVGGCMPYVIASVEMLAFTSEQIVVPFLLPHMVDTVVTMLNYFLLHLVSLYVKSFGPRQSNEGGYRLKILLKEIVRIYVHLARGDKENIFPAAISKDSQSNCKQLFIDVAEILQEDCSVEEFIELGTRVNFATQNAIETEASLGEIPNDFLDPIEFKLMEDPVVLPSTKTVDRSVIQRHLLNYDTDPFNGLPLTQEMIIPNVELKAKIVKFTNSKLSEE